MMSRSARARSLQQQTNELRHRDGTRRRSRRLKMWMIRVATAAGGCGRQAHHPRVASMPRTSAPPHRAVAPRSKGRRSSSIAPARAGSAPEPSEAADDSNGRPRARRLSRSSPQRDGAFRSGGSNAFRAMPSEQCLRMGLSGAAARRQPCQCRYQQRRREPHIAAACRSRERNESCASKIPVFIVNTSRDGAAELRARAI